MFRRLVRSGKLFENFMVVAVVFKKVKDELDLLFNLLWVRAEAVSPAQFAFKARNCRGGVLAGVGANAYVGI